MSATVQVDGTPARSRSPLVVFSSSQWVSRARSFGSRASPSTSRPYDRPIARGLVVSVTRPGSAEFSSVSQRSSRVTGSPIERANRVTAVGPPSSRSSRLAAVLSLYRIATSASSATVMPSARCSRVWSEPATRSASV